MITVYFSIWKYHSQFSSKELFLDSLMHISFLNKLILCTVVLTWLSCIHNLIIDNKMVLEVAVASYQIYFFLNLHIFLHCWFKSFSLATSYQNYWIYIYICCWLYLLFFLPPNYFYWTLVGWVRQVDKGNIKTQ